jgi:C1A family cysteine protease
MMHKANGKGLGWVRDLPDFRDYTPEKADVDQKLRIRRQEEPVKTMLAKTGAEAPLAPAKLPASVMNLEQYFSAIEDQGSLGSCTANAGVALVEYFERRAFGRHIDASRLFLYKATRNLLHWTGDTGAYLRTTMQALVLFGVPPEEYCRYDITNFDADPSAFCYAFAQNFQTISYYRYDPPGTPPPMLLNRIRTNIAAGLPSMFGFTVYSSIDQAAGNGGAIPFPTPGEQVEGGHAVVAMGYDDNMPIRNTGPGGSTTTGALRIRNSWGTSWGDAGYGWLPYAYVLKGVAVDWWSILKNEWIDTGNFGL